MNEKQKNIVYDEKDIITFPSGIPGFEKVKQFVLSEIADYAPFQWLVAVDGANIRFAVLNPLLFEPQYSPKMVKEQLDELHIQSAEDIVLLVIVTIRDKSSDSTANLSGPIIINAKKRIGKQIIVEDDRYSTRHRIVKEGS